MKRLWDRLDRSSRIALIVGVVLAVAAIPLPTLIALVVGLVAAAALGFAFPDRDIRVGSAVLRVRERTDRCLATASNPDTGRRDADTLGTLDHWGHRDFSVRAEVIEGGEIRIGDAADLA